MERLTRVECPDSTYRPKQHPLVFSRAEGSIIVDAEDREYIDLSAGFGVLALGHNHPIVRKSMGASDELIHAMGDVYPSIDKILFLETLAQIYPRGPAKSALALSGSQAVEIAIKTSMLATKRTGFICFKDSYHGLDLGVLPLTYREDFRKPFLKWMNADAVEHIEYGCSADELNAARIRLEQRGYPVAGLLVEPVQGRAGCKVGKSQWLNSCAAFAADHGIISIVDDIFAGMGRTGVLTHAELANFDLVCLGKAIGGGLPISACLGRLEVMNAWPECTSEALHTGTFFGHPLACRVGTAAIKHLIEQKLPERAIELGHQLHQRLQSLLGASSQVKAIQGKGLMVAIEFDRAGTGAWLMDELRAHGVVALASGHQGQCLAITPALNIPEQLLWGAVDRLQKILR
jgi:4-aminobutyrate aminotransferase/(S)-3-amino-2-methylpropionate transaminase